MRIKFAFTLAEIMIVLTVIGVLSAILLPVAFHSAPDENVMKFKKGNNTLGTAIRELVNSDKYYLDGDLGKRPNGKLISGANPGDKTYFCQSLADILSTKSVSCNETINASNDNSYAQIGILSGTNYGTIDSTGEIFDTACKNQMGTIGAEIVTADDIVYFQTAPNFPFGVINKTMLQSAGQAVYDAWCNDTNSAFYIDGYCTDESRLFSSPQGPVWHADDNGFDRIYKIFCMDIDGINNGEDPFGYGIRADGKIQYGKRANEWAKKAIQQGDD